jgi:LysM repeat protein
MPYRTRLILAFCLFVFITITPVHANTSLIDPNVPATDVNDMFNKVNALRTHKQRASLAWNDALTRAAQEQADYISHTGNYAHIHNGSSPGSRALAAGYQTTEWCCSENTHRTQVGKSAWLFWNISLSHYYNMINPKWTEIGAAVSNVGPWTGWVLVFGSGIQSDPAASPTTPAPVTATTSVPGGSYRVAWGDTLSKIALRYGITVADLRAANGLASDLIYAGQLLVIPNGQVIPGSSPGSYVAQITSPLPGSVMKPGFAIRGTARFDPNQVAFYKVEVSGGQFGAAWVTVGSTHSESVLNGELEFLHPVQPGQYQLQLVIVGRDGSVLQPVSRVWFSVK